MIAAVSVLSKIDSTILLQEDFRLQVEVLHALVLPDGLSELAVAYSSSWG